MNVQDPKPLPYAHRGNLTTGPIEGHLLRMTLPMIWGLAAVISVQLADTYFISLMKDTDILAGISFTFPVTMLISHLVFGINIALSSVVSRLIGARDLEDTRRVVLHGILMAFGMSCVIALITFIGMKPIFTMLGATDKTYPAIAAYMPLWLVASLVMSIAVNCNSAMRAAGDTFTPALVMVTIAVINFMLAPAMIFGFMIIPAMGVHGAALATLIAYAIGTALALYILIVRKKLIATDGLHRDTFGDSMKRLLVIAIPAGVANIIQPATNAFIMSIFARHGTAAVAAYGIMNRVEAMAFIFVLALGTGMAPIVGQNWGAGHTGRAHKTVHAAIVLSLIWSVFVAIILAVFAKTIAGAFSNDPAVIYTSALLFWFVPISYGFGNLVYGWASALNAMGKPKKAFMMILVRSFVLTVPAVYLGSILAGIMGMIMALVLVNTFTGVLFHLMNERDFKKGDLIS